MTPTPASAISSATRCASCAPVNTNLIEVCDFFSTSAFNRSRDNMISALSTDTTSGMSPCGDKDQRSGKFSNDRGPCLDSFGDPGPKFSDCRPIEQGPESGDLCANARGTAVPNGNMESDNVLVETIADGTSGKGCADAGKQTS